MIAWTMNAVSVAEPSVCSQLMSRRDVAEEEVADAADEARALLEPVDRREQQPLELLPFRRLLARGDGHARGSLDPLRGGRVQPVASGPSTCSPGSKRVYASITRVRARPIDLADAERLAEHDVAVDDRVVVAIERAHRRAGDTVALECRRRRRGRGRRTRTGSVGIRRDGLALGSPDRLGGVHVGLPAGLGRTAEVDAAVREDREARHLGRQCRCCG